MSVSRVSLAYSGIWSDVSGPLNLDIIHKFFHRKRYFGKKVLF